MMKEKRTVSEYLHSELNNNKHVTIFIIFLFAFVFLCSFSILDAAYRVSFDDQVSSYSKYRQAYTYFDEIASKLTSDELKVDFNTLPRDVKYEITLGYDDINITISPIYNALKVFTTFRISPDSFKIVSETKQFASVHQYEKAIEVNNLFLTYLISFIVSVFIVFLTYIIILIIGCICSIMIREHDNI